MEYSMALVKIMKMLPRYFDLLLSHRPDQILTELFPLEADVQTEKTTEVPEASTSVIMIKSPFVLLAICEKIFKEMSFIGEFPKGQQAAIDLQAIYLRVLSDLYMLAKNLSRHGNNTEVKELSEPNYNAVDLASEIKLLDAACKLVGIRLVMINVLRTLSDMSIYGERNMQSRLNGGGLTTDIPSSLTTQGSYFVLDHHTQGNLSLLGAIVCALDIATHEALTVTDNLGAIALHIQWACCEAEALASFIRLRSSLSNSCYIESLRHLTLARQHIGRLQQYHHVCQAGEIVPSPLVCASLGSINNESQQQQQNADGYPFLCWLQRSVDWLRDSFMIRFEELHRIPIPLSSVNNDEKKSDIGISWQIRRDLRPVAAFDSFFAQASKLVPEITLALIVPLRGPSFPSMTHGDVSSDSSANSLITAIEPDAWTKDFACPPRSQWSQTASNHLGEQCDDAGTVANGKRRIRLRSNIRKSVLSRIESISANRLASVSDCNSQLWSTPLELRPDNIDEEWAKLTWRPNFVRTWVGDSPKTVSRTVDSEELLDIGGSVARSKSNIIRESPSIIPQNLSTKNEVSSFLSVDAIRKSTCAFIPTELVPNALKAYCSSSSIGENKLDILSSRTSEKQTADSSDCSIAPSPAVDSREFRTMSGQSQLSDQVTSLIDTPRSRSNVTRADIVDELKERWTSDHGRSKLLACWAQITAAMKNCLVLCANVGSRHLDDKGVFVPARYFDEEIAIHMPVHVASSNIPDSGPSSVPSPVKPSPDRAVAGPPVASEYSVPTDTDEQMLIVLPLGDTLNASPTSFTYAPSSLCAFPQAFLVCLFSHKESGAQGGSRRTLHGCDQVLKGLMLQLKRSLRGDDLCYFDTD